MAKTMGGWLVALFLGALVCASTGCAAPAQQQQSQVAHADGDQPELGDGELICRREHRTGTNISKRVCYTREQRERHAQDRRESDQQKLQNNARWGCKGGACSQD